MLLDSSVTQQTYIEDCEVCCRPIEVTSRFSGEDLVAFDAVDIEQ